MPVTDFKIKEKYEYQSGFGSYHEYVSWCFSFYFAFESSPIQTLTIAGPKPSPTPFP